MGIGIPAIFSGNFNPALPRSRFKLEIVWPRNIAKLPRREAHFDGTRQGGAIVALEELRATQPIEAG